MSKKLLLIPLFALLAFFMYVPAGQATNHSNNGTVKIHEGNTETEPTVHNDPHVCTFHVHAFFFDAAQVLNYAIDQQPPTGTQNMTSGSIVTNNDGEGRTGVISLPNGHYKLTVDTGLGKKASEEDKHKVFWVDCATTTTTIDHKTTTTRPLEITTIIPQITTTVPVITTVPQTTSTTTKVAVLANKIVAPQGLELARTGSDWNIFAVFAGVLIVLGIAGIKFGRRL